MITIRNNNSESTISKDKSITSLLSSLKSATPSCKKAINYIIKLSTYYKNIYPSQEHIAQATGVCRQTANAALKIAEEYGFIESTYYHRQTKSYRIAFFFSNPFIRSALLGILPALSMLPIYGSLSSFPKKHDTNINIEYFNSFSLSTDTKEMSSDDEIYKKRELIRQEELKRERLTTNVNKFFPDSYPSDIVNSPNFQKEGSMKPNSTEQEAPKNKPNTPKINFPNALVGKARNIWVAAQHGRISLLAAKRKLAEYKHYYPEGIDNFNEWYNSPEGLPFRRWINER